ncbi:hypothetical protein SOVF_025230 [Spinacia oleracea]|nr:hypothetical protein SOVF_025230 [Spinacia oleracea]
MPHFNIEDNVLGKLKNVGVIVFIAIVVTCIFEYNMLPPPPRICGLPGGPPITSPRVKMSDGRYLAYKETGVPKENAKYKIIFVHGFGNSRHDVVIAANLPREIVEELGLYIVSFDRPGYGESDPDPKRTPKSMALDIEALADQLKIGDRFYLISFSMGGQTVWGALRYIPHRLAGAALLAPVVNYWWSGFPDNLSEEAFHMQPTEDQWAQRVGHYFPWLTYWWNTQKLFPGSSVAAGKAVLTQQDYELFPKIYSLRPNHKFVDNFRHSGIPLDVLVCNVVIYRPTVREHTYNAEGFELSVGTNHLVHFLLSSNTNTLVGNVPPKANLGDLRELAGGSNGLNFSTMIDGRDFDGVKAYKDSNVCTMLIMQEFHCRFHEGTRITFASLYPGCIASTGLFREHIPLFRILFPPFQKFVTKGYVSEDVAGKRLPM